MLFISTYLSKRLFCAKTINKISPQGLKSSYNIRNQFRNLKSVSHNDNEKLKNYFINEGNKYIQNQQYEQAIQSYLKAEECDPKSLELLSQLSALYQLTGKNDLSKDYTLKIVNMSDSHNSDHIILANEYFKLAKMCEEKEELLDAHKFIRESLLLESTEEKKQYLRHIETKLNIKYKPARLSRIASDSINKKLDGIVLKLNEKGIGLYANRDFEKGETILIEAPIVSIEDIEHYDDNHCSYCKRLLYNVEKKYVNEMEKLVDELGEVVDEKIDKIIEGLEIPPINIEYDNNGRKYCGVVCKDLAYKNYEKYLESNELSFDVKQILFPSLYLSYEEIDTYINRKQEEYLRDLSVIEIVAYLLCKLSLNSDIENKIRNLSYLECSIQPLLLKHEEKQLEAIKQAFPNIPSLFRTEMGLLILKSIVRQNAFSIETHALSAEFDLGHSKEVDNSDSNPDTLQVFLNMRDDVFFRGHSLFEIGSLFNHSCDPNIGFAIPSLTNKSCWIALRDIKNGEELQDSYIEISELKENRELRRKIIKELYNFDCECTYCKMGK